MAKTWRVSWHAVQEDRMRILSTLKRLAARPPSPWPVLSVYVNTRPVGAQMTTYRPFLKRRMAEELKALKARSPEHESLAVDFARAQHYLDYDLHEVTRSVAVFASYAGEDLFDAVQLPVDLPESEQQVVVGAMPVLFPLLRMADRYRRTAVAVSDGTTTRLFVLALGSIEVRREVRGGAREDAAAGGPSAHAAQTLEELAREAGASWIVVGGEPAAAGALVSALSPAAAELVLEAGALDPRAAESAIAAEVTRLVEERETGARVERARALVDPGAAGAAALGVEDTLEALRQDRVAELLMSETFPAIVPAWTCRACRAFGGGTPLPACTVCGRETVEHVALREELGAQAQARGAPVVFVQAGSVPAFDDGGGVGAFLR